MTTYNYDPNVPAANNAPRNDQPIMQSNAASIQGLISVDHVNFGSSTNGYHTIIHQGPQVSDPVSIAGIGQTYTKTISGDQQLFYESGSGVVSQITTGVAPLSANTGYSYLPGGILIQWSRASSIISGSSITYPIPFSANAYNVQVTVRNNNANHRTYASVNTAGSTTFVPILLSTNGTPETDDIFWLAIGPS